MNPSELTAEEVRFELTTIIDKYPHNTGMADNIKCYQDTGEEYNDPSCVYYMDDQGSMISTAYGTSQKDAVLAEPVCIVGMWIESFHPEFKEDEVIRNVLVRNSTIKSMEETKTKPWNDDVQRLLVIAQDTQDRGKGTWKDIDLDVHPDEQY